MINIGLMVNFILITKTMKWIVLRVIWKLKSLVCKKEPTPQIVIKVNGYDLSFERLNTEGYKTYKDLEPGIHTVRLVSYEKSSPCENCGNIGYCEFSDNPYNGDCSMMR